MTMTLSPSTQWKSCPRPESRSRQAASCTTGFAPGPRRLRAHPCHQRPPQRHVPRRRPLFGGGWPATGLRRTADFYTGVSAVNALLRLGLPHELFLLVLVGAGVGLAVIGPLIEWLLHFVYERDEALQLLLTFAVVLMCEDVMRLIWGTAPLSTGSLYLIYGQVTARGVRVPVYNL